MAQHLQQLAERATTLVASIAVQCRWYHATPEECAGSSARSSVISPQTRTQPRPWRLTTPPLQRDRASQSRLLWNSALSRQLRYIVIRGTNMRLTLFITVLASALTGPMASIHAADQPADKPEYGTGRTQTPETKGEKQPQGWTGPTTTGVGGAPASSPQGETPPDNQAAPEGSSKTTVEPRKDK